MSDELVEDWQGYQRTLDAAYRAQEKAQPSGQSYVDYWIERLKFGIGYLDMIAAVRHAAIAEANEQPAEAIQHAETALATARQALEAYADVVRDQSIVGQLR